MKCILIKLNVPTLRTLLCYKINKRDYRNIVYEYPEITIRLNTIAIIL